MENSTVTNISRRHHYIPQFYLRKFSQNGVKDSPVSVFDLVELRDYVTSTENIACERDFNTINVEGHEPDAIERAWSDFESPCSQALNAIEASRKFEGEEADFALHLIALLCARSPARRKQNDRIRMRSCELALDQVYANQQTWQHHMAKAFPASRPKITYAEAKRQLDLPLEMESMPRERQISLEMRVMLAILRCLRARKWILLISDDPAYFFVSSDRPVSLIWEKPDSVPVLHRDNPGYGVQGTDVYFPLTPQIVALGRFGGDEGVFQAPGQFVAAINSLLLSRSHWLYSPRREFPFEAKTGEIILGSDLWRKLEDARHSAA